jgi:hypothetical protein
MLGRRKMCTKFVLHSLTNEQKEQSNIFWRLCPELPEQSTLPNCIFTESESLDFQHDFGVKCQSMEWRKNHRKDPKMSRLQKSRMTTLLISFFNKHCMISREFVPEGQTWNIEFWLYVLGMLLKHILQGCQFCLHSNDNVHFGTHVVLNVCQLFLECEDWSF